MPAARCGPRSTGRSVAVVLLLALAWVALGGQRKKNEEPKTQVLPLPPELPMALMADTETLDFHISPLLRTGGLAVQIRQSLNDLIRDTHGETIIKLRAFVAGGGDARGGQAEGTQIFPERTLSAPWLRHLQGGALGCQTARGGV